MQYLDFINSLLLPEAWPAAAGKAPSSALLRNPFRENREGAERNEACFNSRGDAEETEGNAPEGAFPADAKQLMKSKYCIKYELGMCPKHQGAKPSGPLYLLNNGRRLALQFDCKACEMSIHL